MWVFVKLKEMMVSHKDLARKIEELERKYDKKFVLIFEAIKRLIETPEKLPKPKALMG